MKSLKSGGRQVKRQNKIKVHGGLFMSMNLPRRIVRHTNRELRKAS